MQPFRFALGLLFAAGFWTSSLLHADEPFLRVETTKFVGYIIPKSSADDWIGEVLNVRSTNSRWTPSNREVLEAEAAVKDFLRRAQKNIEISLPPRLQGMTGPDVEVFRKFMRRGITEINQRYPKYWIQFAGINVQGERQILCNYFLGEAVARAEIDPATRFIYANDGGSYFWHIQFVQRTKECRNLEINGSA